MGEGWELWWSAQLARTVRPENHTLGTSFRFDASVGRTTQEGCRLRKWVIAALTAVVLSACAGTQPAPGEQHELITDPWERVGKELKKQ